MLETVQRTSGTDSALAKFPGQRISKPAPFRVQLRPPFENISVHLVSNCLERPVNDIILKETVFPASVPSVELIA